MFISHIGTFHMLMEFLLLLRLSRIVSVCLVFDISV